MKDPKKRNELAVEIVVSNFKKLLEQSKALEEEVNIARSSVNEAAIHNSNAQSDLQNDMMAMSLACSGLGEDELLELKSPIGRVKLNLNK